MKRNKISLVIAAVLLFALACMCSNTSAIPTTAPVVPAATEAPATQAPATSSGIITKVEMAKDTKGVLKEPVDLTTVFTPSSVIHAVVSIKDSPSGTKFTAEFYVVDVGSAAAPDSLITSTDLTADGTRYLDFTLTPTSSWPAGSYRVDILVNGNLDQSLPYTVE